MIKPDAYNLEVKSGTRNHKGYFVQDMAYRLVGIDKSGWALICQDNTTCHYVDPDCLQATSAI
ncbi:hypothetical protein [Leptothoe sp. PORK10 BA2]|jgi:hypothetical protein|uniref:hypothetical protein n=1 Tax=Leptothoe sp. PORK10 BA2 TaxID=3110254 RepID=UPI002B1E9E76|nr:hypothetical protein [Leptothoe sp. PORK10 BA2]MEA5467084.1 hypothetical protein [Leptothoe sp. PORK10 BA2]